MKNIGTLGKHWKVKGRLMSKQSPEHLRKRVQSRKGYKHTKEVREKMSKTHGDKKGWITPVNKLIRGSFEYKLWREAVFKRDDFTCIWCGKRGVVLHADHIKQFAFYPELRFAIDNGRTLCVPCHKTTDTYKKQKSNL